jgi:hypothetical protein
VCLLPNDWRHLRSKQFNRVHDVTVRHWADADLEEEALVTEDLVLKQDLFGDLLRAADDERAAQRVERAKFCCRARVLCSGVTSPPAPLHCGGEG